jgi:hypothetical protein
MPQRITKENSGLEHKEWQVLKSLSTPQKIQDYLNSLEFDFAPGDEMDRSVRATLREGKTDCAGAAIFAAAALWAQGERPLILDLTAAEPDFDHVVTLFEKGDRYGAISKTNHAVLRYREPVYKSPRELAMSYFHEYILSDGRKTMRGFSKPFDLSRYGTAWLTEGEQIIDIIYDLDRFPHEKVATPAAIRRFRKADKVEIEAGEIEEYK